jgi:hypothetical protein
MQVPLPGSQLRLAQQLPPLPQAVPALRQLAALPASSKLTLLLVLQAAATSAGRERFSGGSGNVQFLV